jgi:hypothetical protein
MVRSILLTRHTVRGVPNLVTLADGSQVPIQNYSLKPLPFFASPSNTSLDGNINGFGWELSKKLGKILKRKYSKIKIRGNVSTDRTIDTAIGISIGANVDFISVFNGENDPLINPVGYYDYTLPESANKEQIKRYNKIYPTIKEVSRALTETFGVPLPKKSNIQLTTFSGLLAIETFLAQEPTFSKLSNINLNINKKNSFIIPQGIVCKQYIYNIPLYCQQMCSNILQYILNIFDFTKNNKNNKNKENEIDIIVENDAYISTTAALLGLNFKIETLPENYVNANSGLLFTLDDNNNVSIECLGLNVYGEFVKSDVLRKISLDKFNSFLISKINPTYVNLTEIDNVFNYRTR